jgi:hypothetical protein
MHTRCRKHGETASGQIHDFKVRYYYLMSLHCATANAVQTAAPVPEIMDTTSNFLYGNDIFLWNPYFHFTEPHGSTDHHLGRNAIQHVNISYSDKFLRNMIKFKRNFMHEETRPSRNSCAKYLVNIFHKKSTYNTLTLWSLGSNKLYLKIQFLPRRNHKVSTTKTTWLILFREIISTYCKTHKKHTSIMCGKNAEMF